jgi:hypothetical protein
MDDGTDVRHGHIDVDMVHGPLPQSAKEKAGTGVAQACNDHAALVASRRLSDLYQPWFCSD